MPSVSGVESIDTVAVRHLYDSGETAVDLIQTQSDAFGTMLRQARHTNGDHSMADAARRFVNNVETIIQEMGELNGHIASIIELIEDPPAFDYPVNMWIEGANTYIALDATQGLKSDWTKLREQDRLTLRRWAPDVVLEMRNVPWATRRSAEQAWFDTVDSDAEVYGQEESLQINVKVLFIDTDFGLSREFTVYADGSVRVEYMATGELGAAVGGGGTKAEVGIEGSVLVAHRFDSVDELHRFEESLWDEATSVDVQGVAALLLGTSCTNAVGKIGGYGGLQLGRGTVAARLGAGVGRDWKTKENIFYINGRVALNPPVAAPGSTAGSLGVLTGGEVEIVGERRQGIETDRVVVDISFETELSAARLLFAMPGEVTTLGSGVSGGVEVTAQLELDLEDLDTKEAWDKFLVGKLGMADLFQYASLDGAISTLKTGEASVDVDLLVARVAATVSTTDRRALGTFHKEAGTGRPTRWLPRSDIERLSR